jgi:hypothetical protein
MWDMYDSMNGLSVQPEEEGDIDLLPGKSDTKSIVGNQNTIDSIVEVAKTSNYNFFYSNLNNFKLKFYFFENSYI